MRSRRNTVYNLHPSIVPLWAEFCGRLPAPKLGFWALRAVLSNNRTVQIEKPRMFQSTKDIVLSLGILLFAMFITVGFTGLCTFNPGPAKQSGPVKEVDAETFLTMEASAAPYEIVNPDMPEGWIANSARRTQVGQETGTLVGWVIGNENYISLTQTAANVKAAATKDGEAREDSGTEEIGGLTWHKFTGEDVRPLWIADKGDHRLVLESMATDEEMRTAAEQVAKAKSVKRNS